MKNIISKLTKNKTARNGAIFSFFSFLNSGINFLLLIIIANYISPDGYGKLNIFTTSVTLIAFLISLNSTGVISVNFFRMERKQLLQTINAVFLLAVGGWLFFSAVVLLFSNSISAALDIEWVYQWIVIFVCFFQVFTQVNLDIWRLEEKPLYYGLYSSSLAILNFIFTIIFIIYFKQDWVGRVYSQVLCGGVFCILSIVFLTKRGYLSRLLPDKSTFKDVLSFSVPLIPHNVSVWLRQGLDRYIINIFYGATLVGYFSFAYNFANIIQIIGTAFNATNSVYIYSNLKNNPEECRERLKKQTIYIILFFISVTFLVCLGASIFIPIVFPAYTQSISFLIPLCIAALFHCIYLQFVNFLFFYKKTKKLMYITFGVSIFHATCSFLLTRYSIYFAVYAAMVSNILIATGVFLYSRKVFKLF